MPPPGLPGMATLSKKRLKLLWVITKPRLER